MKRFGYKVGRDSIMLAIQTATILSILYFLFDNGDLARRVVLALLNWFISFTLIVVLSTERVK